MLLTNPPAREALWLLAPSQIAFAAPSLVQASPPPRSLPGLLRHLAFPGALLPGLPRPGHLPRSGPAWPSRLPKAGGSHFSSLPGTLKGGAHVGKGASPSAAP